MCVPISDVITCCFEAAIWVKSTHVIKSCLKAIRKEKIHRNFPKIINTEIFIIINQLQLTIRPVYRVVQKLAHFLVRLNWSIFDKVQAYEKNVPIFGPPCK